MKNPLQYYKGDKIFWFRLFGKGLKFAKTPMLFSERNGLRKHWMIFGWRVTWLPKWKSLKDYPLSPEGKYFIIGVDPYKSELDSVSNGGVSIFDGTHFKWQEFDEKWKNMSNEEYTKALEEENKEINRKLDLAAEKARKDGNLLTTFILLDPKAIKKNR